MATFLLRRKKSKVENAYNLEHTSMELTPYEYHKKKNNYLIYYFIERFSAITFIQYVWRKFWFRKTYIPPKYYKIKKKFLEDFTLLPPSECGTFPGGIEYQNAYKDFKKSIENLSNIYKS